MGGEQSKRTVVILGAPQVGKTAVVNRVTGGSIEPIPSTSTIVREISVSVPGGESVCLSAVDVGMQRRARVRLSRAVTSKPKHFCMRTCWFQI